MLNIESVLSSLSLSNWGCSPVRVLVTELVTSLIMNALEPTKKAI